jgi:hypothetical protein
VSRIFGVKHGDYLTFAHKGHIMVQVEAFGGVASCRRFIETKGGVYMGYEAIKLVYCEGKPQWLMPDGSFLPAERRNDGRFSPGSLYLKDKVLGESCLIVD